MFTIFRERTRWQWQRRRLVNHMLILRVNSSRNWLPQRTRSRKSTNAKRWWDDKRSIRSVLGIKPTFRTNFWNDIFYAPYCLLPFEAGQLSRLSCVLMLCLRSISISEIYSDYTFHQIIIFLANNFYFHK